MDKGQEQNLINEKPIIYTLGYQGRSLDTLRGIIIEYGITVLVDVRSKPYSRMREFSRFSLAKSLKPICRYLWLGNLLGGLETIEKAKWSEGIETLVKMAHVNRENILIMCMERDYMKCHRLKIVSELNKYKIHHINL